MESLLLFKVPTILINIFFSLLHLTLTAFCKTEVGQTIILYLLKQKINKQANNLPKGQKFATADGNISDNL